MEAGKVYFLTYRCRDIGYGIEEGYEECIYRGLFDGWGKHEWQPVDGSPSLYLFVDEVIEAEDRQEEASRAVSAGVWNES